MVIDRDVYYRENSIMVKVQQNATAMRRIRGMVELRDCVRHLIDLQMDENIPDSAIQAQQAELNRMYDAYTNKYGLINDRANRLAFDRDDSYYLLCSLEILDEDNKLKSKADMFTKRTIKQHHAVTHVDTASEALAVSIGERARVDLAFMGSLRKRIPLTKHYFPFDMPEKHKPSNGSPNDELFCSESNRCTISLDGSGISNCFIVSSTLSM